MKNSTKIIMAAGMLSLAGSANAALVELKWTTTVQSATGDHPGIDGESLITTIQVDNGGADTISQNYDVSNFVKIRIEGASGWWFESANIDTTDGIFATDAVGSVIETGYWIAVDAGDVETSYDGVSPGSWWMNGYNQIAESGFSGPDAVQIYANDVGDNGIASSWTASAASTTTVTEPSVFALFGLGLVGIGFARRRRS